MDLICVGDVMLDVHVAAGALARGGDVHGRVRVMPGGTSANAAVGAAWAGASVAVVGAVGEDPAGHVLVTSLRDRGVDVGGLVPSSEPTGTMLVVVEAGERSMVADRGANAALRVDDLPPTLRAGAVLVSGYLLLQEPTTETAIEALARADAPLVAVEAASWPLVAAFGADRLLEAASAATVVFANAEEARALTGREPAEAAAELGTRFRIAAVKCGDRGALVCVDGEVRHHGVDPVLEVDPTGAGDAFDGVFLSSLARGEDPAAAADAACRAGAIVAATPEVWPVWEAAT